MSCNQIHLLDFECPYLPWYEVTREWRKLHSEKL